MADKIIQDETLSGIANAIRMQTGSSSPIYTSDMANKISQIESMATNFATGTFQQTAAVASFSFNCPFLPSFLAVFMQILTPNEDFTRGLESGTYLKDIGTSTGGRTFLIYDGNYFYSYRFASNSNYASFEPLYKYDSTNNVYTFPTIELSNGVVTVNLGPSATGNLTDGKLYGGKLISIGDGGLTDDGDYVTYRWIAIK